MKKTNIIILISALFLTVSCEEFQPVFTLKYEEPEDYETVTMEPTHTIMALKALYTENGSKPLKIEDDIIIKGQVCSSDQSGNIYKSFYIQDETGGIEIKIGKSGLYNDYKMGQWIYVKCRDLTLGAYNGMIQLGYADPTGEYDTSYLDIQYIIDLHVFRGGMGPAVEPVTITESQLKEEQFLGRYVTLKGLTYANEIFCLAYVNPNMNKQDNSNRIFLSGQTWGVTTWAMSKNKFTENLLKGLFDDCPLGDKSTTVGAIKEQIIPTAYSVSQYFQMGGSTVELRSSGYGRFSDQEIPEEVLDGSASVNISGILSTYQGRSQMTLIDIDGVEVVR